MKKAIVVLTLVGASVLGFAQGSPGGIQFSGVLSANVIDDFNNNTAYLDNNNGYTYISLDGSFKDGPYGFESQLQFGPSPSSTISNLYVKGLYGYAGFRQSAVYIAVGRVFDLSTFGLNSYYQTGPNGPGVYGSVVGKLGNSGFGIDGFELKVTPITNLVFGIILPYNITSSALVDNSLEGMRFTASYTIPKIIQLVLGYQEHLIGVADYLTPSSGTDPNDVEGKNKFYALANVLVNENLTAGARYELDHDISSGQVISHNIYLTIGGKIDNFSIGADSGFYIPPGGSAGLEILGSFYYTVPSILPNVDLQPYVQIGYFTSTYPMVSDLLGATYTNGFNDSNYIFFSPQLKLLLGKSQHELVLGYSLSYDKDKREAILSQLNVMIQLYF